MLSRVGALLAVCAAGWWAATASGANPRVTPPGEYDGAVTISLSAAYDSTAVSDPAHRDTEQQTEKLRWDQSETVAVYGLDTGSPTFVVTGAPSLTVSGSITTTAAAPNQSLDCSGTLSARPGAPLASLFSVLQAPGRRELNVGANFVPTGDYIQSTGSGACRADPGGGVGLSVGTEPTQVLDAMTAAETPIGTYVLSSPPVTQTFTSGGPQSTPTRTSSFSASFTVGPSCQANAGAAADAAAESCAPCPNPADDPLLRKARQRASDIVSDDFTGNGRLRPRAEAALLNIRALGKRLRERFPQKTGPDRVERKRRINKAARKADAQIKRAYDRAKRALDAAEADDAARAKCPDVKQKIRDIYAEALASMDQEYKDDLKFVANEVVGTVAGFCGCHLSRDQGGVQPSNRALIPDRPVGT